MSSCAVPQGLDASVALGLSGRCRPGARRARRRPCGARPCPRPRPGRRRRSAGATTASATSGATAATMPTPQLNARSDSSRGTPCSSMQPHRRRAAPTCRGRARPSSPSGTTRAVLPASPPPVMCAKACTRSTPSSRDQRQAVAGVDAGRLEQLLAQRPVQPGRGGVQVEAGGAHDPADQRVAVGVEARTTPSRSRRRRRATRSGPEDGVGLDHARPRSRRGRTRRRPSGRRARRSRRRPGRRRPGCSPRRCR